MCAPRAVVCNSSSRSPTANVGIRRASDRRCGREERRRRRRSSSERRGLGINARGRVERSSRGSEPVTADVAAWIIGEAPFSVAPYVRPLSPSAESHTSRSRLVVCAGLSHLPPPPRWLVARSLSPIVGSIALAHLAHLGSLRPAGTSDFKNVTVRVLAVGRSVGRT